MTFSPEPLHMYEKVLDNCSVRAYDVVQKTCRNRYMTETNGEREREREREREIEREREFHAMSTTS